MNRVPAYSTNQELAFERLSPDGFERLCSWLAEAEGFGGVERVGGAGDRGVDVVAEKGGKSYAFQCKRTRSLSAGDMKTEIDKMKSAPPGAIPDCIVFVTSASVSKQARDQTRAYWGNPRSCLFWAGMDLDRMVKRHPKILREYFYSPSWENSFPPREPDPDPSSYLHRLVADNLHLDIRGLDPHWLSNLELTDVYTRFRVRPGSLRDPAWASPIGQPGGEGMLEDDPFAFEERGEGVPVSEVLRLHSDVVIEGGPGSGKTTLLRFLCLHLARAHLQGEGSEALRRVGLDSPPPFPVFVRLTRFGDFLATQADANAGPDAARHLLDHLDAETEDYDSSLPTGFLSRRVAAGDCVLFLDGLDEVSDEMTRARISRIIEGVAALGKARKNRHVVSSRSAAYMGEVRLGGGFARATILDFSGQEIEQFVRNWTRALIPNGRAHRPARPNEFADGLFAAINGNFHVRRLAGNPLMLTAIAVVYFNGHEILPPRRSDLLGRITSHLLRTREDSGRISLVERERLLTALAVAMYQEGGAVRRTAGLREARSALVGISELDGPGASAFLEEEAARSGIIVSRTPGIVEFWHLNFQEFLAGKAFAVALSSDPAGGLGFLRGHVLNPQWREVVLHLAGCLLTMDGPKAVSALIQAILDLADRDTLLLVVELVGDILISLGPESRTVAESTTWGSVARRAGDAVDANPAGVPLQSQIAVLDALALHIGTADWEEAWEDVPPGSLTMGAQSADPTTPGYDPDAHPDESPVRVVSVDRTVVLKHLVSVHQYSTFVQSGAYSIDHLWSAGGRAWKVLVSASAPLQWSDQQARPNRPVIGVTWWEAEAFSNWLTDLLGYSVRLPTESEWEFFARGSQAKRFATPTGLLDPGLANVDNLVGGLTPSGLYPSASTEYEVYDLAGNVWEWCLDSWIDNYEAPHTSGEPRISQDRPDKVRRGGCWRDPPSRCRAAFRSRRHPSYSNGLIGFRLVRAA